MTRSGLDTRLAAFRLLDSVLRQRSTMDNALARSTEFAALSERDRAFARNLVTTTLRRLGQVDALIDHALERPLAGKAKPVGHILRLGITQLLFLDTPAHAAVDTAVELARNLGFNAHRKLVNAVLRRLAKEGPRLVGDQDAERVNTPDWLWASWSTTYGEATCRRIAAAHLREAPFDITVKADADHWAGALDAKALPWGTLRRPSGGNVSRLPGFADGAWWVQDGAARAVLELLGAVGGKTVIDLCAAPGGKTAYLANAGARVVAVDRSKPRLERLDENLARLGLAATTVHADAVDWRPPEPADVVLLDAPCSATGTIRRHPEVAWLKGPGDVEKLQALQARLLRGAAAMVRPGGIVLFCTCSLEAEEGPEVVGAACRPDGPFDVDAAGLVAAIPAEEFVFERRYFRSFPFHFAADGGVDGFFAARLVPR